VNVSGVFASVPLFDDGTGGDVVAGDGIYERDMTIPASAAVEDQAVLGSFVDQAGNVAAGTGAPLLLTVRAHLEPIDLLGPLVSEPPDDPSVTLRWSISSEESFSAYRIFRSESAPVDSTDKLLYSVERETTLEYEDLTVVEGRTYRYRVYVQDAFGRESGSNTVQAFIPNLRPPSSVRLSEPNSVSTTRIALDWGESGDLDFHAYRVYRNSTGAVADDDPLMTEIDDRTTIAWDDTGLRENTVYYYRVYVVDDGAMAARSNEVEARTKNEAPPAVTLHAAASIDSTSATLSWGQSLVHDFAFYRLYRDEIPTVTTGSALVVELDDLTFTSFRDVELASGTRYYYRVFVVDEGDDAKATGSNTITLETPTP
jgi:fibronectin type 3 domain-containing protein